MKPAFLILLLGLYPAMAPAQVIINPAALQQLAGISPPVVESLAAPEAQPVVHHVFHKHPVPKPAVANAKPLVAAAKPVPVLPVKPIPVVAKPAPPRPAIVTPVTLAFAGGSAALPENAGAALQPICAQAKTGGFVNIAAYAAGDGAGPSGPMRLSLSRALAVRDALVACGVPATTIIPRALGNVAGKDSGLALISLNP